MIDLLSEVPEIPVQLIPGQYTSLHGLDAMLRGYAETSCNYVIVGAIPGAVGAWTIHSLSAKRGKAQIIFTHNTALPYSKMSRTGISRGKTLHEIVSEARKCFVTLPSVTDTN